jgi:integrase
VQPSGVKSYVVVLGRGQRRTIGSANIITLEQAKTTARAWLSGRDEGKLPPAARGKKKPATLAEFLERKYEPWAVAHKKSGAATVANIRAQFGDLLSRNLDQITAWQIERFKSDRLKAGIAPATVNRDLVRIRSVLNRAVEWGAIEANPLTTVKRLKGADDGRIRFLSPDEEARLRDALQARETARRERRDSGNEWAEERGHQGRPVWPDDAYTDHLSPLVLVAMNTGLRRGELFSLRWSDVDLCAKRISLRAATTKSQRVRHVPLNTEAMATLKRWKSSADGEGDGYVFPGPGGGRMTNVNKSWAALIEAAKIVDFRFHDLRHHFASRLVQAGVDLYVVKELLGHGDFAMTQRYAHLAPEHKAAAVERIVSPKAAGSG